MAWSSRLLSSSGPPKQTKKREMIQLSERRIRLRNERKKKKSFHTASLMAGRENKNNNENGLGGLSR
jgi:hypothetical protein